MTEPRCHWLIGLYPKAWRERYGDELNELLREQCGWRDVADVLTSAFTERLFYSSPLGERSMRAYPSSVAVLARKPSAILPIVMSLGALSVVLIAIATGGAKPQPDEGAAAHIWQLLIAGQLPFLGWFALRWLKRDPRAGLSVLAIWLVAFGAALFPVWYLGL